MDSTPKVVVSFRSRRVEFDLRPDLTVDEVKSALIVSETEPLSELSELPSEEAAVAAFNEAAARPVTPADVKLLFRGKVLDDGTRRLSGVLEPRHRKVYRLMAVGRSAAEVRALQGADAAALARAPRVRDDLTAVGQRDAARRRELGRRTLRGAARREERRAGPADDRHGFGRVETLPGLPDEGRARAILTELANDPGILTCMEKHGWRVGSLAELPPEGRVGESAVCVMGLNRNKGQQILLRIRTDDVRGFRKKLSIRKVLYHELAHNVHSEHNADFFRLMREVEKECNELDWTQGAGTTSIGEDSAAAFGPPSYDGGTFRLGGGGRGEDGLTTRELRAQAAMERMTEEEEEEILRHCGCGRGTDKFLPAGLSSQMGADAGTGGNAEGSFRRCNARQDEAGP